MSSLSKCRGSHRTLGTKTVGAANPTTLEHDSREDVPILFRAPTRMIPYPQSPRRIVPPHIARPLYAETGSMPEITSFFTEIIRIHDDETIPSMRRAGRLARKILDMTCSWAKPGVTTDEIDAKVHEAIIQEGAYPSPLNYSGFPKSVCTSINEVVCHGIPDLRPLQIGDVVSFDVSCYLGGVHGDNCATVIVGDDPTTLNSITPELLTHMASARRLVQATKEGLEAGIAVCKPGACLSEVGHAIHAVADEYGYDTVRKYRGHGISETFHTPPYVKHFRNRDRLKLLTGMIFTIEPMFTSGSQDCGEWIDEWTVVTMDDSIAAQFEHTVLITSDGVEILTTSESDWNDL